MIKIKPKILVTGGAGFIGSALSNKLNALNYQVFVLDNLSKGKKGNLNSEINFFKEDIKSKSLPSLIKKIRPDVIFHLAAQSSISQSLKSPQQDFEINVLATQNLIEMANTLKVKKFIFASSAAVYGESKKLPFSEDSPKNPISVYGLSKLSSEFLLSINRKINNLPFVSLRYANVYGEKQNSTSEGGVVAIFIKDILDDKPVTIYGDGKQTRDYIHLSDVTSANLALLNKNVIGEFNISTGHETTINDVYLLLLRVTDANVRKVYKPFPNPEVKRSALAPLKFHNATNWSTKITLREGLKKTFEYFKNK